MRTIWYPATVDQALKALRSRSIPVKNEEDTFVEFYDTPTPGSGWQKEISLGLVWTGGVKAHHKTSETLDDDTLWDVCMLDGKDPNPQRNTKPRIYKTGSGDLYAAGIVYTRPPESPSLRWRLNIMQVQRLIRARTNMYVYPYNWPYLSEKTSPIKEIDHD